MINSVLRSRAGTLAYEHQTTAMMLYVDNFRSAVLICEATFHNKHRGENASTNKQRLQLMIQICFCEQSHNINTDGQSHLHIIFTLVVLYRAELIGTKIPLVNIIVLTVNSVVKVIL